MKGVSLMLADAFRLPSEHSSVTGSDPGWRMGDGQSPTAPLAEVQTTEDRPGGHSLRDHNPSEGIQGQGGSLISRGLRLHSGRSEEPLQSSALLGGRIRDRWEADKGGATILAGPVHRLIISTLNAGVGGAAGADKARPVLAAPMTRSELPAAVTGRHAVRFAPLTAEASGCIHESEATTRAVRVQNPATGQKAPDTGRLFHGHFLGQ